jgi:hypothetical protein
MHEISEKIIEQQMKKCVHFTGIMDECCAAGVKYSEVRAGPMMFPCLKSGGECTKAKFLTREEAEQKELEVAKGVGMYLIVKDHVRKTGKRSGSIKCNCGGTMLFAVASNDHIRASCSSCQTKFME